MFINKFSGDVTPEEVIEICGRAMKAGEKDFGVKSRLILACIVGLWDYAMPIAKMALKYKDIVCGIDVAGYENGHIYKTLKEKQQVMAYEFAVKHDIKRTAHAGEAVGPTSVKNVRYIDAGGSLTKRCHTVLANLINII